MVPPLLTVSEDANWRLLCFDGREIHDDVTTVLAKVYAVRTRGGGVIVEVMVVVGCAA